jgi:exo-1,4-beta-D-glucosaminidase
MRRILRAGLHVAGSSLAGLLCATSAVASTPIPLAAGWRIESSAKTTSGGETISRPGFDARAWHPATVPATVVAALVANGDYPDPYFGMNLRAIPGMSYPIGEQFAKLPMAADSPFNRAWWYRVEFQSPGAASARSTALHFDGINYRANVWVNGVRIAAQDQIAGAYRRYEFDISRLVKPGANAIAVEIFAPTPGDLGINWVDWNPTPPDKNMGLWGAVYLTRGGPVTLRHSYVRSTLDVKTLDSADLDATTEAWNLTDAQVRADVIIALESGSARKSVTLGPREHQLVRFTAADDAALHVARPRVWWPYRMGTPNLYTATFTAVARGGESDREDVRFGIRQVTSELTPEGHRLFRINGRRILIRGGGWASDMLLRPLSAAQLDAHMRYVREMGLNTIRQEGKLEPDAFYARADELGILVMPGWCCCDQWEMWEKWDAEDHRVGPESLRDQLLRLRNHPSVFVWLNGSDKPPPADVEQKYLDIERELEWDRPTISSAAEEPGPVSGPSGVKMRGPYDYVPPSYWLLDTKNGGAFGFATEISPGAAVPPVESLEAMLPEARRRWPIDAGWNYHAGGSEFKDIRRFTDALEARYGKATDVRDYTRKAQALTYETERAMFEGYARNKYRATGVIQWMLNNGWPSIIWHLYDYYMRPGGGYFGTKAACEPLHVQYSYDDRSIVVVNDTQDAVPGVTVTARLLNFSLEPRFSKTMTLDVAADEAARAFTIPEIPDLTTTYFLQLTASGAKGDHTSRNFYWLSAKPDVLSDKSEWYFTPTVSHGELTALGSLPPAQLTATATMTRRGSEPSGRVTLANTGRALAFQVRLKAVDATGTEILPVYWQDNYVTLLPGERREIAVSWPSSAKAAAVVAIEGWNVASMRVTPRAVR